MSSCNSEFENEIANLDQASSQDARNIVSTVFCGDLSIQVIIPALNEESTITGVLDRLKSLGLSRIRVVDNGSTDQTARLAQEFGAEVLTESRLGYGQACWTGLQNLAPQIEWILFCDADGSDVLEELPQFFDAAHRADFILGNRRSSIVGRQAMTPAQNFGNWLATTLIHLGWGGTFADLGPLRLIRRDALERLQMQDRGFGWTVEMQTRAVEEGLKICELPVSYRDRQGGKSKISGTIKGSFKAGSVILGTLGKLFARKLEKTLEPSRVQKIILKLSVFFLISGAIGMAPFGDFQKAGIVPLFLIAAAWMSAGFITALSLKKIPLFAFWSVAIGTRLILLWMTPGDDIWRYLWEGLIQNHGFSPYAVSPDAAKLEALRTSWWPLINHPDIAAIYPPLAQLGFRGLALFTPSVWLFKLGFIGADLVCCFLLQRRFGVVATLAYAWNPLVIYCFAGGGHYDAWFLLPLIAGCLVLENLKSRNSLIVSALLLGASVAIKYISLPIVLFAAYQILRTKGIRSALLFCIAALLPFVMALALIPGNGALMPVEFIQFARSSEFIPYWIGLLWPASIQMNWIYSIPLAALGVYLIVNTKRIGLFGERYLFGLLVLAPVVHAWYFTWLIPFSVRRRNLGIILLSVSGFVYFWLKQREAVSGMWEQSIIEKLILWLPLIFGFLWQLRRDSSQTL